MNSRDYFPLGKAIGKAFCNRKEETLWLVENIKASKHSLLMAPRRFGKSSLAEKALQVSGLEAVNLSFNTCANEADIELSIRSAVSELIGLSIGTVEKSIQKIKNFATHLTPRVIFGTKYATLELIANQKNPPAVDVENSLLLIEKLLESSNKTAVMVFDEFQIVGLIAKGTGIEAAIRNVLQSTRYLSVIFSGSNRHLLASMFEDSNRPLYKLCRKLHLGRIEESHYLRHLNQAAQRTWGKNLSDDVFVKIMFFSKRHPYYVNYLCDILWSTCKTLPLVNDVEKAWGSLVEEEKSDAKMEIANLPMGQKQVLKYVATYPEKSLLSASALKTTGIALSSAASALNALVDKDILEQEGNNYQFINPVVLWLLQQS